MRKKLLFLSTSILILVALLYSTSCGITSFSFDDIFSSHVSDIGTEDDQTLENYYIDDNGNIIYEYSGDVSDKVLDQAKTVTSASGVNETYDQIKYSHDWIIQNCSYDLKALTDVSSIPDSSFCADGVFFNGVAVCQGYAEAFYALMVEYNIECKIVYGYADDISHAWNMVKLDGEWYHVDVTWDDPLDSNSQNGVGTSNLIYDYFLMPDSVITQTHTISYVDDRQTAPACTSTKYVYYPKCFGVNTAVILSSTSEMPSKYFECIKNGNSSVTFFFPDSEDYSNELIYNVQHYVAERQGSCSGFSISYSEDSLLGYKYITLIPV